jgi:hypothetical protein
MGTTLLKTNKLQQVTVQKLSRTTVIEKMWARPIRRTDAGHRGYTFTHATQKAKNPITARP